LLHDLRVVAGYGWNSGVVGYAISVADESSPQGRAFVTGEPQVCPNIAETNTYILPAFYAEHGILSTVDVLVATKAGLPFGVLEVDSPVAEAFVSVREQIESFESVTDFTLNLLNLLPFCPPHRFWG
jgi:hypothetical protein